MDCVTKVMQCTVHMDIGLARSESCSSC